VEELRNPLLHQAFQRLNQSRTLDFKATIKVAALTKAMKGRLKQTDDEFQSLVNPLSDLKEDGEGNIQFRVKNEHKAEWDKVFKRFQAKIINIEARKLTMDDIQPAGLSPAEVVALEPFMDMNLEVMDKKAEEKKGPSPIIVPPMSNGFNG